MRWKGWPFATLVTAILGLIAGALHPGELQDRLVRAADALPCRLTAARLADAYEYRALGQRNDVARTDLLSLQTAAAALRDRWEGAHDHTAGRQWAEAELLSGNAETAATLLSAMLESDTGRPDPLAAVQASRNAALLTDFSAAMLQRPKDTRALVLAIEAADRAWELAQTSSAAWNRALAAERVGAPEAALRAWRDSRNLDSSPEWKAEAMRHEQAAISAAQRTRESPEIFFQRDLPGRAAKGIGIADVFPADRLASDASRAVETLTAEERERFRLALETYARGRDAFARDLLDDACDAFSRAERELDAIESPLALLVREQHIRCRCVRAEPGCLDAIRALRAEVLALRRYPWLAARAAYAEGQTLYRQGHLYEAVNAFNSALQGFAGIGDTASAGLTHSVLGNTLSAAGETDAALAHHLAAVRLRFLYPGDRRRIELEDAMLFLLRHGYVATAELLLEELSAAPATEGAQVMEAVLRGVIAFRRGDRPESEHQFERAQRLGERIEDSTLRAEAMRSVLLAEAGCGIGLQHRLDDMNAAASVAQQEEMSLWLPRMLTERGIELEAAHQSARAEQDFLRAISILERREPRIDQSSLLLGISSPRESPFDHAIRLYLREQRIVEALAVAERSMAVRISSLHARGVGVRDVFRSDHRMATEYDIRSVLPAGDVAVAQYLLSDALITWVITQKAVRVISRGIHTDQLIGAVNALRSCASRGGCSDGAELDRVSDILLRDWIERVPRGATLWLHRPVELQAVPFVMLKTRAGERLLSRNPLTNAPGFAAFVRAQQLDQRRDGELTAFLAASPHSGKLEPLPMARAEVTRAALFYDTARVEPSVSRRTFAESVSAYRVVHFAGHVLVNDEQPLFSALAFDDGLLYMHELDRRAFSRVRLVVLSGCDSGRTPLPVMSMANALLSQDVPSVVSTLWPIDDAIAAQFAVVFHRAIAAGKSRAESLQQAALSMWERSPDRPDAWAAFQLAGAPGPIAPAKRKENSHGDGESQARSGHRF